MWPGDRRTIELQEGVRRRFTPDELGQDLAHAIYRTGNVEVGFPSPPTAYQYELCSASVIGQVPIGRDALVRIEPKVPVRNLFRMLEYAYNLKSFAFGSGLVDIETLEDLYERLALILACRILDRIRRGLYRRYLRQEDALSYVRGRIALPETMRLVAGGQPRLHCLYEDHTADLDENQILLWTMHLVSRMALERADVRARVRAARLALTGAATLRPVAAAEAAGRVYNRLNDDYRPMHALCRFFLENTGPGHDRGARDVVPFTVNMARLFESFLAEWLRAYVPPNVRVRKQHRVILQGSAGIAFQMDVVLFDRATGRALAVIDAKYKRDSSPSTDDLAQVVAYAVELGTTSAFLVYPTKQLQPQTIPVGGIRVQALGFDLGSDLTAGGADVLGAMEHTSQRSSSAMQ